MPEQTCQTLQWAANAQMQEESMEPTVKLKAINNFGDVRSFHATTGEGKWKEKTESSLSLLMQTSHTQH